ncbi:hypothetical protein M5K25_002055 [Dendrobium thyrsiflorum]|uniref:Protein FAR1-RELATED SEQUENCE n=1 Tax=Dendrobium thyrsiflorum TaxID=117978 RepID=A0ABD0VS03_DENTH
MYRVGVYTSEKEAYEMYCDYAHNIGFSVRKEHHSYWPNSRKIKSNDFVCSKAGYKKGIDLNSKSNFRKFNTRTGCPAMIRFVVSQDGVWTCDSEEEFEKTWSEMITEGDLQSHDWLKDLYRIKNKLSIAFNKNYFNLGILSTQRSESTNNVCHGISKEKFLQGVGGMCIVHASTDSSTFFVKSIYRCDQPHQWTVHFDAVESTIECSCGKFGMMGILCSHTMRVFRTRKYIYTGPTIVTMGNNPSQSTEGGTVMIFRNDLNRFAYQISTRAQGNEDAEQYMLTAIVEMADNVDFILAGKKNNQKFAGNTASGVHKKVKDPVKCKPKGISNARLKSH